MGSVDVSPLLCKCCQSFCLAIDDVCTYRVALGKALGYLSQELMILQVVDTLW